MEVLHPRCAGLDIHKDSVVACVRRAEGARVVRHVETFATTTADLERLSAWLKSHGVTHVVMEATGVYWVDSSGRRNTAYVSCLEELVQSLGRCSPAQGLSRSAVEGDRHGRKVLGAVHAEVSDGV